MRLYNKSLNFIPLLSIQLIIVALHLIFKDTLYVLYVIDKTQFGNNNAINCFIFYTAFIYFMVMWYIARSSEKNMCVAKEHIIVQLIQILF